MSDHASLYARLKGNFTPPAESRKSGRKTRWAKKDLEIPGFERVGAYTFRRSVRRDNPLADRGESLLEPGTPIRNLFFFDTETTGLSGGAGNTVFLLGTGQIGDDGFSITQYFLADFPGEAEFVSVLAPVLTPERRYVSYNGRAFDAHLLVSRFNLNRRKLSFPLHTDLLPLCRRFWKRCLDTVTLKNVETCVLSSPRGPDLEGWEVPERYFRFLRRGDATALADVFEHNLTDVYSLARILALLESMLENGIPSAAADPSALAALLFPRRRDRAVELLEQSLAAGDKNAGHMLGFHHKRTHDIAAAQAVWERLFLDCGDAAAGIELAKIHEHREHDIPAALAVVEKLLERHPPVDRKARALLVLRRDRLLKKMKAAD